MASGAKRVFFGSFNGTGAALDVTVIGFRPSSVKLYNLGGLATAMWQQGMADASALKEITAGTKSLIVADGITPLSNGFRLGADGDLNVAGELVRFECTDGGDENA